MSRLQRVAEGFLRGRRTRLLSGFCNRRIQSFGIPRTSTRSRDRRLRRQPKGLSKVRSRRRAERCCQRLRNHLSWVWRGHVENLSNPRPSRQTTRSENSPNTQVGRQNHFPALRIRKSIPPFPRKEKQRTKSKGPEGQKPEADPVTHHPPTHPPTHNENRCGRYERRDCLRCATHNEDPRYT